MSVLCEEQDVMQEKLPRNNACRPQHQEYKFHGAALLENLPRQE